MNPFPSSARETTVAPDRTHHLWHGRPWYTVRFKEVRSFHEPGPGPVSRMERFPHHARREALLCQAFCEDFRLLRGCAAVVIEEASWQHIKPDGTNLGTGLFAWCGNFQEGFATVRGHDGRYHHIDLDGHRAYDPSWHYAGDFREGMAVVQREDGLHTHIDRTGNFVHDRWFHDLDVFHKGFARARDEHGWTHVSWLGIPVSNRRFAMVEPFYNGQARVERFDGGLEIIDETGITVQELRPARTSEFARLSADLVGFWSTETSMRRRGTGRDGRPAGSSGKTVGPMRRRSESNEPVASCPGRVAIGH